MSFSSSTFDDLVSQHVNEPPPSSDKVVSVAPVKEDMGISKKAELDALKSRPRTSDADVWRRLDQREVELRKLQEQFEHYKSSTQGLHQQYREMGAKLSGMKERAKQFTVTELSKQKERFLQISQRQKLAFEKQKAYIEHLKQQIETSTKVRQKLEQTLTKGKTQYETLLSQYKTLQNSVHSGDESASKMYQNEIKANHTVIESLREEIESYKSKIVEEPIFSNAISIRNSSNTVEVGCQLTAVVTGEDESQLSFQWFRSLCGNSFIEISDATAPHYIPSADDVGAALKVEAISESSRPVSCEIGPVALPEHLGRSLHEYLIQKKAIEIPVMVVGQPSGSKNDKIILINKEKVKLREGRKTYAKKPFNIDMEVRPYVETEDMFSVKLSRDQTAQYTFAAGNRKMRDLILLTLSACAHRALTKTNVYKEFDLKYITYIIAEANRRKLLLLLPEASFQPEIDDPELELHSVAPKEPEDEFDSISVAEDMPKPSNTPIKYDEDGFIIVDESQRKGFATTEEDFSDDEGTLPSPAVAPFVIKSQNEVEQKGDTADLRKAGIGLALPPSASTINRRTRAQNSPKSRSKSKKVKRKMSKRILKSAASESDVVRSISSKPTVAIGVTESVSYLIVDGIVQNIIATGEVGFKVTPHAIEEFTFDFDIAHKDTLDSIEFDSTAIASIGDDTFRFSSTQDTNNSVLKYTIKCSPSMAPFIVKPKWDILDHLVTLKLTLVNSKILKEIDTICVYFGFRNPESKELLMKVKPPNGSIELDSSKNRMQWNLGRLDDSIGEKEFSASFETSCVVQASAIVVDFRAMHCGFSDLKIHPVDEDSEQVYGLQGVFMQTKSGKVVCKR